MSKDKEISATEKLLDMIRGEEDPAPTFVLDPASEFLEEIEASNEPINLDERLAEEIDSLKEDLPSLVIDSDLDGTDRIPEEDPPPVPEDSSTKEPPEPPQKDLDDTEKDPVQEVSVIPAATPVAKISRKPIKNPLAALKITSKEQVGIDIQDTCINFAKVKINAPEPKLTDYLAVPIPGAESGGESPDTLFQRPDFRETLSHNLNAFCRKIKNPEIWCSFQSERTQIHNITIPKVPPKEIAKAVFWSTKKEIDFDPVEYIYDFSIIKEIEDGNLQKIITLVYLFPRKEVDLIKDLFKKIGYPLTGITHSSSAVNNFFQHNILETGESPCVHLHFENQKSHIDIYFQGDMLFTREIKTGINSYTESIFDQAVDAGLILDDQSAIECAFNSTRDRLAGSKKRLGRKEEELGKTINLEGLATTGRLVRQLNRTFDFCSTNFRVPRATKLYTSGFFTLKDEILKEIQGEIDFDCSVIDIFKNDLDSATRNALTKDLPDPVNPLTAFGLAFANNTITPNILFTFADKKKTLQENKVNQIISVFTIVLACLVGAVFFFQFQSVKGQKQSHDTLNAKLEQKYQSDPRSRNTTFATMATKKIVDTTTELSVKAKRFAILALVTEVTSQLPEKIQLTDFKVDQVRGKTKKGAKQASAGENKPIISVTGFISGADANQNFILLNFQKKVNQLSHVAGADIFSRKDILYKGDKRLFFTMKIDMKGGAL